MPDAADPASLRDQFPVAAAGTAYFMSYRRGPLPAPAVQAVAEHVNDLALLAGGTLEALARGTARIESARSRLARLLDAPGGADTISFHRCTTDAIATIAAGLDWRDGDEILITDREYPANVYPWLDLRRRGVSVNRVRADAAGRLPVEAFRDALTPRTRLVACSAVCFSTGYRIDVPALAELCREWGARLVVDAVQAIGAGPVSLRHQGADAVVGDGRKFLCALDGAAFLWASEDLIGRLHPPSVGANSVQNASAGNWLDYDLTLRPLRRFEPGGMASASLAALDASLGLWESVGFSAVGTRIDAMVEQLLHAARAQPGLLTPDYAPAHRSAIVALRAEEAATIPARRAAAQAAGVQAGFRDSGDIILSPHAFNNADDVQLAIRHVIGWT